MYEMPRWRRVVGFSYAVYYGQNDIQNSKLMANTSLTATSGCGMLMWRASRVLEAK